MCSFPEKIQEIYKAFIQESGIQFSELEEKVLQFHLSNLEYACGSNLSQVSFDSCVLSDWAAQKTELEVILRNHLIHSMALEEESAIPAIPTPITSCLKALRHWLQRCRISADGSSWHASREMLF